MAQVSTGNLPIPNDTGANFRADVNENILALQSNNSGDNAPSVAKAHQTWIDTITKQCDQLKIGLKAYRYLSEGIELANELGIQLDEAELIRTNSTGLTIYNPSNLASMIKGMKNKQLNNTREAKILARKKYEESLN